MIVIILILTGLCVGIISSFFGVGGGIVAIPALYTIFPKLSPQIVIGSLVSMVALNSLVNLYNYRRKGRTPNWQYCAWITWPTIIGVNFGATLTDVLPAQHVKGFFVVLMLIMCVQTLASREHKKEVIKNWQPILDLKHKLIGMLVGIAGGIVAGLTGLGGGVVMVPLFILLLKMPLHWTPVYSNVLMAASGCVGSIRYMLMEFRDGLPPGSAIAGWQVGQVNWAIVFILVFSAFFTSRLGVIMNERFTPGLSRIFFAGFMFLAAINVFFSAYGLPWK